MRLSTETLAKIDALRKKLDLVSRTAVVRQAINDLAKKHLPKP